MMRRRRNDDDEGHGTLRDGEVRRVPLYLRDGGDWRGEMHRHLHRDRDDLNDRRRRETRKYDPRGRLISTAEEEEETEDAMTDIPRRPGFTRDALDKIEAAYRAAEQRDAEAWRHLKSHGDADVRRMRQGDAAPELTGDAQLDAELTLAANIEDRAERAYAEVEARDRHAWKR